MSQSRRRGSSYEKNIAPNTSVKPDTAVRYGISLNADSSTTGPDFLGGNLGRKKARQRLRHAKLINPITLTVHANPIDPSRYLTTMGYKPPPKEFPLVTIATAIPLFRLKYVVTKPNVGQKIIPLPNPVHSPCASNSCHRFPQRLTAKMPTSWMALPITKAGM